MAKNRRLPDDEEIDGIARMARESRVFYQALAKTLRPRRSRKASAAEAGEETGGERQEQQK